MASSGHSVPAGPGASTDPHVHRRGLTYKQAAITLFIVLVLGLLASVVEVYSDWRNLREEVREQTAQILGLVHGSAVEAAYQLNTDLATQVVGGLFSYRFVQEAVLRDNFQGVLAEQRRSGVRPPGALARALFGDLTEYVLPLEHEGLRGSPDAVGQLEVTLAAQTIAERFIDRTTFNVVIGVIRALVISALVVVVFYLMITRPLLRLNHAIGHTDPLRPGAWPRPDLPGHDHDELGQLSQSLNRLLTAFQTGLDQRDQAQRELMALTQELESRVAERTAELEQTMADLEAEKAETERAFHRLDHAHRDLEKANHLVLESIRYARRIQTATLPDKNALGDAVRDIHVCWEPLHLVGGDYFWLERFGDRSVLFVADCTGHGVPGAFLTLVVASSLDRILHEMGGDRARDPLSPAAILDELDVMVRNWLRTDAPDGEADDGLDAAVCVWDRAARTLTFAGAGLPLIYVHEGEAHEIRGARGGLGYRRTPGAAQPQDTTLTVHPDMRFYLLTDGVPDHMGGEPRRLLGRRRLRGIIARNSHLPMAEQIHHIQHELERYRGSEPRRDDMTLIGFHPL